MRDYSQLLPVIVILCIVILVPLLFWTLFARNKKTLDKTIKKLTKESAFEKEIRIREEDIKRIQKNLDEQNKKMDKEMEFYKLGD
jgi:hypothetical protein